MIILLVLSCGKTIDKEYAKLINKAEKFAQIGELDSTIYYYQKVLIDYQLDPKIQLDLIEVYKKNSNIHKALMAFDNFKDNQSSLKDYSLLNKYLISYTTLIVNESEKIINDLDKNVKEVNIENTKSLLSELYFLIKKLPILTLKQDFEYVKNLDDSVFVKLYIEDPLWRESQRKFSSNLNLHSELANDLIVQYNIRNKFLSFIFLEDIPFMRAWRYFDSYYKGTTAIYSTTYLQAMLKYNKSETPSDKDYLRIQKWTSEEEYIGDLYNHFFTNKNYLYTALTSNLNKIHWLELINDEFIQAVIVSNKTMTNLGKEKRKDHTYNWNTKALDYYWMEILSYEKAGYMYQLEQECVFLNDNPDFTKFMIENMTGVITIGHINLVCSK